MPKFETSSVQDDGSWSSSTTFKADSGLEAAVKRCETYGFLATDSVMVVDENCKMERFSREEIKKEMSKEK